MLNSLTLALTAYNEEDTLRETAQKAVEFLTTNVRAWELLIVDDGSIDRTQEIALSLAQEDPRIRLLQHSTNLGMGAAIRTAIREARGDWFCTIAADGQVNPHDLRRFLDVDLVHLDAVFSTYEDRADGWDRWILSQGLRLLIFLVTGVWRLPTGNYFVKRKILEKISFEANSFFVNYEVFLYLIRVSKAVKWIQIPCALRKSGASKVRNLKTITKVASEVIRYRMR